MYTVHGIHVHSILGTPDKQYTHVHVYCTWIVGPDKPAVSALISREYA